MSGFWFCPMTGHQCVIIHLVQMHVAAESQRKDSMNQLFLEVLTIMVFILLQLCVPVSLASGKSLRKCANNNYAVFRICGQLTPKSQRKTIIVFLMKACRHYVGCPIGDQDRP